ncbi:MAG: hypothetical protein N2204_08865, partial [Anaerolineae bacterium]|nr:hypothetical protein [Anaerolineae bacterium]
VKHILRNRGGHVLLEELAAATAQRQAAVEAGLAWLAGRGHIEIEAKASPEIKLAPGTGVARSPAEQRALDLRLEAALAESAAYRAYYRSADPAVLLP